MPTVYSPTLKQLFSIFLLAVSTGCSFSPEFEGNAEAPYSPERVPQVGDVLHVATGHYISQAQLLSSVTHYPLVYVGEVHDNQADHRLQLDILKAMYAEHQGQTTLGMEMFDYQQQPILDLWSAGQLSEKELLRQTKWFDNWSMDFEHYRDLLLFCRDNNIPVIGLNTPKALGRKVSMTSIDQLDEQTKQQLPEMDISDPYQNLMIEKVFGAHGTGKRLLQSFKRRQTLWDETMAETIANYMDDHPQSRILAIAGGWHVRYGFGIPRRVHRRLPIPYVLVNGEILEYPAEDQYQSMDVKLPDLPLPVTDYLVFQKYELLDSKPVKLGVALDDTDSIAGILMVEVTTGSVAEKAGIQKGDRLITFDGETLKDGFDLIYAVKATRPGDLVAIELIRDDKTIRLKAQF